MGRRVCERLAGDGGAENDRDYGFSGLGWQRTGDAAVYRSESLAVGAAASAVGAAFGGRAAPGGGLGDRRYGLPQERHPFGGGSPAVLGDPGQSLVPAPRPSPHRFVLT